MHGIESKQCAGSPSRSILINLRNNSGLEVLCPTLRKLYKRRVNYLKAGILLLYRPMFIKSGRKFSSAMMFLSTRTRDRIEDIADSGVGLGIIRGTRRSSSVQRVARALDGSGEDSVLNGTGRVSDSCARVTGIFLITLLNKELYSDSN
jgi:hypothetical protein